MEDQQVQSGGVGGYGVALRAVALNFHDAPERIVAPQVEAVYYGGDAGLDQIISGVVSVEYTERRLPVFFGFHFRQRFSRFEDFDCYWNVVVKAGPIYSKNLGVKSGGRFETGLGILTPIAGQKVFWDFNLAPHLFYDAESPGDFLHKVEITPALISGATFY